MAPILRYLKNDRTLALSAERQRRDGITALGAAQGNRMQYIMSANGAAAWECRCFFVGVFCAGLSALTRCDFKNPARWAGLLCHRALGACCRRHRHRECQRRPNGVVNAKGVRIAKGRVGELANLPCLLRPMNHNPDGVAHDAGAGAGLRNPVRVAVWFLGQTQGDTRVARATLIFHDAAFFE
jgi:hypothetical protein